MIRKLRSVYRRVLLHLTDIPPRHDLSEKEKKLVEDWLFESGGHRGFRLYCQMRDRAVSQHMLLKPLHEEAMRHDYMVDAGRRLEIAGLANKAELVSKRRDKERRKKETEKGK